MVLIFLVYLDTFFLPGSSGQFVPPSSMLSKCNKTVYMHMSYEFVLVCIHILYVCICMVYTYVHALMCPTDVQVTLSLLETVAFLTPER